ncbi:hypothetical protein EW145_g7205 [Phellinidium pouzarii]|uniref:Uncharacterized protein n=1 Tax=Phellinidium pouzarii TaxID=167371 RepID=A0A4S4KN75_9AGAM|nr:hypothetical protein EW145_g7205 [Phellinidium pouzarii]
MHALRSSQAYTVTAVHDHDCTVLICKGHLMKAYTEMFVPSEFGIYSDGAKRGLFKKKDDVKAHLRTLDLPYAALYIGVFPDLAFIPQATVLASVCFVFGTLFVCFSVDHNLLFGELSEKSVEDGFFFYTTFYNAPPVIKVCPVSRYPCLWDKTLLHSVVGAGVLGLIGKLHKWDESAMFFDGSSLVAYVFAIGVYLSVSIPALRTIVDPVVGVDTREDRIEAMRILSAGNIIIMGLLGVVLCFQGGEEYARRIEVKELAKWEESQKAKKESTSAPVSEDKKEQ